MTSISRVRNERKNHEETAFKRYKKWYPDLDEQSWRLGWVAGVNSVIERFAAPCTEQKK